jgi:predicted Kef-type K+ transport protein
MDPIWIFIAFILGFLVKQIGLPPLVGFLAAGFVLNAMGVEGSETLNTIANFGVYLLLFSIGLKLDVKGLLRPQIWASASLHMLLIVLIFGAVLFALSFSSIAYFTDLNPMTRLVIAFALSFSSTVFAVKILEETGEMSAAHGKIAIGILIMQDIFAVVFLTFSAAKLPSPWALALIALLIIPGLIKKHRPLSFLVTRSGHGELLVLLGILLPIGFASLFGLVGLKPDLGALVAGILFGSHPKAEELSNAMLGFKDLFLVGFFLTIGLSGTPDFNALGISMLLAFTIPIKIILFFLLLTMLKLRARTALLASFSLGNYSEFGLIVGAAAVSVGWLNSDWLVIFAIVLSVSFILASPVNMIANTLYARWHSWLQRFETKMRLPEDEPIEAGDAEVIILGMGRVGSEVYKVMIEKFGEVVLGIDDVKEKVNRHLSANRNVILGDVTDSDFWERVCPSPRVRLVILAISNHFSQIEVIEQLKRNHSDKVIAALCKYEDEHDELKELGVDIVFNLYSEAGLGYAEHVYQRFSLKEVVENDFLPRKDKE